MSGYARFHEVMEEAEEVDEGKIELSDVRGEIKFENVSFGYSSDDGKLVLSELSLDIKAGKTLALVGSSGGGKTTVCNLIPRFYNIKSGKITLDGIDLMDIKLNSLRSSIGIVSQNVFLFDGTVRDNIAYGNFDATDEEIKEAARKANIHDFILTMDKGYDTEVGERGVKLSGGQKQRIAIARVFLKNPKILILDEATSALDNTTEVLIQASLDELCRGRTTLVVAHRLSTIRNADEIAVVVDGNITEKGTHEDLLKSGGTYRDLYALQFRDNDFFEM
jgi:ATP-binding cassette subfamily B protein